MIEKGRINQDLLSQAKIRNSPSVFELPGQISRRPPQSSPRFHKKYKNPDRPALFPYAGPYSPISSSSLRLFPEHFQCLGEIGDQIIGVLNAGGYPEHPWGDPHLSSVGIGHMAMGAGYRMIEGGPDSA